MSNFNFKRLIKKYSKIPAYELRVTEGGRDPDSGIYIPGKTEEILIEGGAVVPLSNDDLNYDEGGTYTTDDRKLYCYAELRKGTKVRHKAREYTIQTDVDYSDFDIDLNIYTLKRGGSD